MKDPEAVPRLPPGKEAKSCKPEPNKTDEPETKEIYEMFEKLKAEYEEYGHFKSEFVPSTKKRTKQKQTSNATKSSRSVLPDWKKIWTKNYDARTEGPSLCVKGMCFTSKGQLAVADEINSGILILNRSGNLVKILKGGTTFKRMQPIGLCQSPSHNLLVTTDTKRVTYLDPNEEKWESSVKIKKTHLYGVSTTRDGKLILINAGPDPSVGIYETDGRIVREFDTHDLNLNRPLDVASSEELGIIFVVDSGHKNVGNGCVYMFDNNGRILNTIGRQEEDPVRLIEPSGVCCFPRGQIGVTDRTLNRLVLYDLRSSKAYHMLTEAHGLQSPYALANDRGEQLAIGGDNHGWKVDGIELKLFQKI